MKHHAKKRFGQHFLTDHTVLMHIVACINPVQHQRMVEIGPGLGALTQYLLPHLDRLDVVELDRDVIPVLQKNCQHSPKLVIHQADALCFDFSSLISSDDMLAVVGNLPYNISTPLLFHLLQYSRRIDKMCFMLQQEVVDRLAASPGTRDYGRLSVMIQYHCSVFKQFDVPPTAFSPPPKVDSAVVTLVPYQEKPFFAEDYNLFSELVQQSFSQRRKTLRNNLKGLVEGDDWLKLNINPQLRAENLSVKDFVGLANALKAKKV